MQLPEKRRVTAKWRLAKEKSHIPSYSCSNFKPRDQYLHRHVLQRQFKTLYNNQNMSFKYKNYSTKTVLSKHIWDKKENMYGDYSRQRIILKHAKACSKGIKTSNLCRTEKHCILNTYNRFFIKKITELDRRRRRRQGVEKKVGVEICSNMLSNSNSNYIHRFKTQIYIFDFTYNIL